MTGTLVVVATLLLAVVVGLLLRAADGRIQDPVPRRAKENGSPDHAGLPARVAAALVPETPVTLVQISTTFCSRCPHVRAQLADLAARTDGLRHAELDVTHSPEIAHELGVRRTPTTIAFGPDGTELLRVGGVPDTRELLDTLSMHLGTS